MIMEIVAGAGHDWRLNEMAVVAEGGWWREFDVD